MRQFSNKRYYVAAAFAFILSGCTITPAVDVVSWTIDGVSYFLTGKGVVDHTMSAASGQDCAWARVIKGDKFCVPNDEDVVGDRMVFTLDASPWTGNSELVESGDPLTVGVAVAEITDPLGGAVRSGSRSTAIAAVAADNIAAAQADAIVYSGPGGEALAVPDRDTRLWLPVREY